MKVKPLIESYKRDFGYVNTLVVSKGVFRLYEVSRVGRVTGYELGRVRIRPLTKWILNEDPEVTHYECKWSNEDFGKIAYYLTCTKEEALRRFDKMVEDETNVNHS